MMVSGIIPCYNAITTVERAIESLLRQTYQLEEIIVINDGSNDGSRQLLDKIQSKDSSLKILHQENSGVSAARNAGIAASKGTYLLMLDADDYFEPTYVEKALNHFQQDKSHAAIMCGYYRDVDGKKTDRFIPLPVSLRSCLVNNGTLACLLYKREALIEIGCYDEGMLTGSEDWDLNLRLLKAGYTFGIIREYLFTYTLTPGSRTELAVKNYVDIRMEAYRRYEKHFAVNFEYIYKELITMNQKLRKENAILLESRSFRLGNKILSSLRWTLKTIGIKVKK